MAYITPEQIMLAVPLDFPDRATTNDFEVMRQWITRADGHTDAGVGPGFPVLESGRRFKDAPDTPVLIQECSLNRALSYAYEYLQIFSQVGVSYETIREYRNEANNTLKAIREEDLNPFPADPDANVSLNEDY